MIKRNIMRLLITWILVLHSKCLLAGQISTVMETDPGSLFKIVQSGSYPEVLRLVRGAYAESHADPSAFGAESILELALNTPAEKDRIQLAIEFSLAQNDFEMNLRGTMLLVRVLVNGATFDRKRREQIVGELKNMIIATTVPSKDGFKFVQEASDLLLLLGNDAGLDLYLTSRDAFRSSSVADNWSSDSSASVFRELQVKYDLRAKADSESPKWDMLKARLYGLCSARRDKGQLIEPIHPWANLDHLESAINK